MAEQNDNKGNFWSTAAPLIGSVLDFGTGLFGSIFNRNEAETNRQFQREMYEKQFADNLRLWHMSNNYNLPSAQLERLKDANLNPLLMYSNGASGVVATTPNGASQPSGSQASSAMQSNFNQGMLQSALLKAQIHNIEADTEQKTAAAEQSRSTSENLQFDVMFKRLCKNVDYAIKQGNLENVQANTNNLVMNTLATGETTFQTIQTMRQAREYEIKRYNLDYATIGMNFNLDLKRIANDTERVKQGWRGLAIQWLKLQNDIRWTNEQIGALRWNVLQDKAMFGLRYDSLSLDNKLKKWDIHLKKADFNQRQINIWNSALKTNNLWRYGTEDLGGTFQNQFNSIHRKMNHPSSTEIFLFPKVK